MLESYRQCCFDLEATGKVRKLPERLTPISPELDFTHNDYLGLCRHPDILAAGLKAAREYGVGASGSRLLSGNPPLFSLFEAAIAQDKHTDSALIFNSGFQANLSVLASLLDARVLGARPVVFFDKANHASMYQAVFLSGAELVRYKHLDYAHLESSLQRFKADSRPKFIVTETVFGMDGDVVSIPNIEAIAAKHKAFIYLDEAHAVGMVGPSGFGLSTQLSHEIPSVSMGTFSKAVGVSGGYVASSALIKDYLLNKAQGFIYSTANSPFVIGAAFKAWQLMREMHAERERLMDLAQSLRLRLKALGLNTGNSTTHIIPIIHPSLPFLQALQVRFREAGIGVSFIRPPTVPPNASRLRIAINTAHSASSVNALIQVLCA
ncbi:MAG: 8-amino-7-oxononanoate synthase [Verrucomicrobia bacterium 21-51-4]|nr:MAG: 8-amino-7-oxononanoate synthase [Verrucomicrobia bacterium 21-51-4]